jgi:signal transduction histidine kinase
MNKDLDYLKVGEDLMWRNIAHNLNLAAGLFLLYENQDITVLSSYNIPIEPFNGNCKNLVIDVIEEVKKVPKDHYHNISKFGLSGSVKINGMPHVANVALVTSDEGLSDNSKFFMLGFPCENKRNNNYLENAGHMCSMLRAHHANIIEIKETRNAIHTIEVFVKEIGHDFASSMQVMFSKLSYMASGRLDKSAMMSKSQETLDELKNAYALADSLSLVIDPSYKVDEEKWFDLSEVIAELHSELQSEANEKTITIDAANMKGIEVMGDQRAIKIALFNLTLNAIKYAHSDTKVEIGYNCYQSELVIFIRNTGIGLPRVDPNQIWDLGYRSSKAKSMHVNGSGIGLHTVKKIALAHQGRVWDHDTKQYTTFSLALPKNRYRNL